MSIISRNRLSDPNLDQIAWAEHALEDYDVQQHEGIERPILSQSLVEEAAVIGGIPHELVAATGLRLVSRTQGEYWFMEKGSAKGGRDG